MATIEETKTPNALCSLHFASRDLCSYLSVWAELVHDWQSTSAWAEFVLTVTGRV